MNLIIGGIVIPAKASMTLSQGYDPVQATHRARLASGDLIQRTSWSGKLSTTINGGGLIPAGLQLLDYSSTITIGCIAERAVTGGSNVITIPAARRSDVAPIGRALVGGVWQDSPVSIVGDEVTITVVAGATQYQAVYWPELICFCDPPSETRGARNSDYGWTIAGEEV